MKKDQGNEKIRNEIEEEAIFHEYSQKSIREMPDLIRAIIHYSLRLFYKKSNTKLDLNHIEKDMIRELNDRNDTKDKIDYLLFQINLRIKQLEQLDYLYRRY